MIPEFVTQFASKLDPNQILFTLLTTVGATVWAFVSSIVARVARQQAQKMTAERDAANAAAEKARQDKELYVHQVRTALVAEALRWGRETVARICEAEDWLRKTADGAAPDDSARRSLMASLSALVDAGRLFFPNHSSTIAWPSFLERPKAMRGFRQAILDAVMIAHAELANVQAGAPDAMRAAAENVVRARREFVSELQQWIDPRALGMASADEDWTGVAPLVDSFEKRFGEGKFWGERPMPGEELKKRMESAQTTSALDKAAR